MLNCKMRLILFSLGKQRRDAITMAFALGAPPALRLLRPLSSPRPTHTFLLPSSSPSPVLTFHWRSIAYRKERTTVLSSACFSSSPPLPSPPVPSTVTPSKHYIPRKQRTTTDGIYEIDRVYDSRLKRRRRIDPTRELNYQAENWESHKSVYRRIRHILTTFGASPFQRLLFPDLFITSAIAGGLTYYNEFVATEALWMDGKGLAAGTTAIALLSGFRLNASYGRYAEARTLLGAVNTASRDLASNATMWLTSEESKDRMLRMIKAFSVALIFHLNAKGAHHQIRRNQANFHDQVYSEFRIEMLDVFQHDEKDEDFVQICNWFRSSGTNVPLGITLLLREIISQNGTCSKGGDGAMHLSVYNRELDMHVQKLVASLGGCERIQKTPIPTCFTRHTSRLIFMWSTLLPFAIYPVCGPFFTLPSTLAITYSILGLEDIGVQIEEPFNILPLRQYSDGVYDGVDFIRSVSTFAGKPHATK
jgi:putative membrane protein